MIDTTEILLAINSIRKVEKKKPSKSNICQYLKKDKKPKELEYETFDQLIENLQLSGTIVTKTDLDSFYISNDNVIIERFDDILLGNISSNNKMKSWKITIKITFKKKQFETPKRFSFKKSDTTNENEIYMTQSRYEVLSDSDENDTNGCNYDNKK